VDDHYVLELPYADHRELILVILKYCADVEVLGQESLLQMVREELERTARTYIAG
jgi:predicted DNA-binding transcriptional regulator YafY